jgi:type II secretory pathway pseudopilin PulG
MEPTTASRQGTSASVSPGSEPGFTLIELLVALVLLDIGLLALVALGTTITRTGRSGRAALIGASVASARLERMASVGCAGVVAGRDTSSSGVTEIYSDTPAPNGTRLLSDSVTVIISRGQRDVVISTAARC